MRASFQYSSCSLFFIPKTESMSSQILLLFLIILTNLSAFIKAQNLWCYNNGNYTRNSTYDTNLNTLLSSLPSNMDNMGYYNASLGQTPDRANAIALCRSDIQLDSCRACIQNATVELVKLCPYHKQAILWKDVCTLRYSNDTLIGRRENLPSVNVHVLSNVLSPEEFNENLRILVDNLTGQAASGGSLMKVAAGSHRAPDFQTIYALLQCTPDLFPEDCSQCLNEVAQTIPQCCNNSRAVTIYAPTCYLQYELGLFYNLTRIQEAKAMISVSVPVPVPVPAPTLVPPIPSSPGNSDDNTSRTAIIIVVVIVVSLILVVSLSICLRKRMKKKRPEEITASDDKEISVVESFQYDFGKVRAATNEFSDANKLGKGGFGVVYKGKFQNGQKIAVKRLARGLGQGDSEFKNEVLLVAKLQHKHLIKLLGFALEGTERLLVYEFAQNASLDHHIFDPIRRFYIGWDRRYKIIGGIARGLLYLHEDSRFRIIHRDLKASNILLDGEMNPKIADFGMARLFVQDESEGRTSRIVGTYGYMAPEYARHGQLSVKQDVFSFGVLVLEIISGQKNNSFRNGENEEHMLTFAWRNWREGTTTNIIDPVLRTSSGSSLDILRCIHIALLCVQENAADRPTMASVVIMLNSISITLPVPSQPAFFMSNSTHPDISPPYKSNSRELDFGNSSRSKLAQSTDLSRNDVSITELYPR